MIKELTQEVQRSLEELVGTQPFAERLPFRVAAPTQPGGARFLPIHKHLQDRHPPDSCPLETPHAHPVTDVITPLVCPYPEQSKHIAESGSVGLQITNSKQVSLWSVHEHKGGVVDGRGLLGRVLCPLSGTDIGP